MRHLFVLVWLCLAAQAASAQSRVYYVLEGAVGSGRSWGEASGNLRATLAEARAGDQVWVGPGTFAPTGCTTCDRADQLLSLVLPKGVQLRGGFSGTETAASERIPAGRPTVLSGRIGRGAGQGTESFTILTATDPTPGTLIESIRFEGGRGVEAGHGLADAIVSGAQLDVIFRAADDSSRLDVTDCAFVGGTTVGFGGAVLVDGDGGGRSRVLFRRTRFEDNHSDVGGGAVYVSAQERGLDRSRFEDCRFSRNTGGGEGGGALYWTSNNGGRLAGAIEGCTFEQNRAEHGSGGAVRVFVGRGYGDVAVAKTVFTDNRGSSGGAFAFDARFGGQGQPTLTDVHFGGNLGTSGGGAFYSDTNAGGRSDPRFERCTFRNNSSEESGGAIYFNAFEGRSFPRLVDCRIEASTARLYGGAIYNFGRGGVLRPTLINTVIAKNSASSAGGIYALGSERGDASATIINCAFVNNRARVGGALYSNANDEEGNATPYVLNTVFQGNSAPTGHTLRNVYGRPTLAYCSFDSPDCEALRSGLGSQQVCGPGNLFGVGDVFVDTAAGDYRLRDGARVVDAGLADTLSARGILYDLAGAARFRGRTVDIGPIELASAPLAWSVGASRVDSAVCLGGEVRVSALVTAPFPTTGYWSFGESRLSTERAPSLATTGDPGLRTYVYTAEAYGEQIRDSVRVRVRPLRSTSLAIDDERLRDTLVVGTSYDLLALASPLDLVRGVRWHVNDASLADTSLATAFVPGAAGRGEITVEVRFAGNCPDVAAREAVVSFVAKQLGSAVIGTLADGGIELLGNPVGAVLALRGLSAKPTVIELFDVAGGLVVRSVTAGEPSVAVSLDGVAAGPYVLTVGTDGERYAQMVVRR